MNYLKWNKSFVNYYFENNEDKEIILYADKDIINKIGEKNELGGIEDFLQSLIVDYEGRREIYKSIFGPVSGPNSVVINKGITKGSLFDFALFLADQTKTSKDLPFLNYVILAVYIKSEMTVENTDRNYYKKLNNAIRSIDQENQLINSDNINLDKLFNYIEAYDSRFKNKQIGNLKFMGLLKYQLVLSPKQKYRFEEILYKNKLSITEDTTYHEFANRFLSITPIEYNHLKEKIRLGGDEPVYSKWFLNQATNFEHTSFSKKFPKVKQGKQSGEIAFCFNGDEKSLYLVINTEGESSIEFNGYQFNLNEKTNDGFSINPVLINGKKETSFKEYSSIENDEYKFSFIKLRDVNFLQKNEIGNFRQTLNPVANTETYVIVKNDKTVIDKWKKWKKDNTTACGDKISVEKTKDIFTEEYVLYYVNKNRGSINKEYYTKELAINPIDYSKELKIKKIGGYRIEGKDTYFDIALPKFKILNPITDNDILEISVKVDGDKDKEIICKIDNNIIHLSVSDKKRINSEGIDIEIFIKLNNLKYREHFMVIPSMTRITPIDELFKLNGWGVKSDNNIWYNGVELSCATKIKINDNRNEISNLSDKSNQFNNYFIHLLSALSNKKEKCHLFYRDIKSLINSTKDHYDLKGIKYSQDDYSNTNIIRNLIALGYINEMKNNNTETIYQIAPPSLIRLERSFSIGGNQVYKLVGVRSRSLEQKIIEYCKKNNISIKYRDYNTDEIFSLEHIILPSLFFINSDLNTTIGLKEFIRNEINIELNIEDMHHIGNSLLNYINSVSCFEKGFLKQEPNNYENQEFEEQSNKLPRIIKSAKPVFLRGKTYKKEYLRISNDNKKGVYNEEELPIDWAKLYVEYKHKNVVLFIKSPIKGDKDYNYSGELLIPKTLRIPSIIYKALTETNHGLSSVRKCFIIDAQFTNFDIDNKRYILFDKYSVVSKKDRRENVSRIFTGKEEVRDNEQVAFYEEYSIYKEYSSDVKMFFSDCETETFSSFNNIVSFYSNQDNLIAFCTNYKDVYLINKKGNDIYFDNETIKAVRLNKGDKKINEIFSLILKGELNSFNTSLLSRKLFIETKNKEEIQIIKINKNGK